MIQRWTVEGTAFNPGRQLAVSLDYPTVLRATTTTKHRPKLRRRARHFRHGGENPPGQRRDVLSCPILKILCATVDRGSEKRVKLCRGHESSPSFTAGGSNDCPARLYPDPRLSSLLLNFENYHASFYHRFSVSSRGEYT